MDSLEHIGFENYKIFKDKVLFDIKPFTLFTGPNNAGKSTILDGIKLLTEAANSDSGLRTINAENVSLKNYDTDSNRIKFITGIRAETPMKEWSKIKVNEQFILRVFTYYVERTYLMKKNTLDLIELKFLRNESPDSEFLKLELLSLNKVKINFNFREFLLINEIDCEELLDQGIHQDLQKQTGHQKSYFEEFLSKFFFQDIEISRVEDSQKRNDIMKFEIVSPAFKDSTNKLYVGLRSQSPFPHLPQHKKNDGIGDFIIAYFFLLKKAMTEKEFITLSFSKKEREDESLEFSSMSLFSKLLVKSTIECEQIFAKFAQLEDTPIYLYEVPDIDVVRAPSTRLNKADLSFQNILSRCKKWQDNQDEFEYRLFIEVLKFLGIGISYEITENKNGILDFWIIEENKQRTNLLDQGFGTNQIIPILLQVLFIKNSIYLDSRSLILISEPEANLHPNLQSKFIEALTSIYSTIPLNFIMETHSEYMIRKFQIQVQQKELKKEDIIIYYLSKNPTDSISIKRIQINEDGTLSEEFGQGFLDEADNLAIDLFNLKRLSQN